VTTADSLDFLPGALGFAAGAATAAEDGAADLFESVLFGEPKTVFPVGIVTTSSADSSACLPRFNVGIFGSGAAPAFGEAGGAVVAEFAVVGLVFAVDEAGVVAGDAAAGDVAVDAAVDEVVEGDADAAADGGADGAADAAAVPEELAVAVLLSTVVGAGVALVSVLFVAARLSNFGAASVSSIPRGTADSGFFAFFVASSSVVCQVPSPSQTLFGAESAPLNVSNPCETPSRYPS
jgi:hypothetical protein